MFPKTKHEFQVIHGNLKILDVLAIPCKNLLNPIHNNITHLCKRHNFNSAICHPNKLAKLTKFTEFTKFHKILQNFTKLENIPNHSHKLM